ncbi:11754_t:CDS:2 [Diversispora eburnea]|uniref:11754_t:CDS:1 n=1 Tax=Diversispora eburnea TaxID=1213867 RepID=A0A9N9CJ85_9GLOM|nr:11754_t:CDS:2 [Diversispora eburnea]
MGGINYGSIDNPTTEDQDNTFSTIDTIDREESLYNSEEIQIYVRSIINDDVESRTSKKLRNTKITDFIKSHYPHPKHIQKQLEESCKAKHEYLGITVIWITPDFKIKDVILEIKYAPSPHTTKTIAELLYQCKNILQISCAAHILQLAIAGNSSLDNININYLDENIVFETEIFTEELLIEIEDEEIINNISKRSISIKNSLNTTGILEKVKNSIYSALIYYWDFSNNIELIASLLDPCYKILNFVESEDEKKRIIQKLHNKLNSNNLLPVESFSSIALLTNDAEFSLH